MIDSMKLFADKSGAIKEDSAGRGKNNAKGRPKTVNYGDKSKSLTAVNSLLNDNDLAHTLKEKGGDSIFLLSVCPENAQHDKDKAHIKVAANGDTTAACKHNSCKWGYRSLHKKWTGEY